MRVVVREGEAGSAILVLVVRLHGIAQTTGLTYDRNRSVAEGDQLAESARLEEGRHQICIAGSINLMADFIGIVNLCGYLIMVLPVIVTEHVLVLLIPGTEHHELDIILAELIHDTLDEIEALLVGETGYDTDHHLARIHVHAELLLECLLVLRLLLPEVACVERLYEVLIRLRIPVIIVDAVNDAAEIMRTCAKQSIEALSVERHLDLLRIGIGNRRDRVGIHETTLQEVTILLTLELIRCEVVVGQLGEALDRLHIPYTLELEVMDRDHRLDGAVVLSAGETVMQQYRNETGLPVVTVDHIRMPVEQRQRRQRCIAEEAELLEIPVPVTVWTVTGEIRLVVDEVVGHALVLILQDADIAVLSEVIHIEVGHVLHLLAPLPRDAHILRNHDTTVIVLLVDGLRKRADDVRESARLDERHGLRCEHEYVFHYSPPVHISLKKYKL